MGLTHLDVKALAGNRFWGAQNRKIKAAVIIISCLVLSAFLLINFVDNLSPVAKFYTSKSGNVVTIRDGEVELNGEELSINYELEETTPTNHSLWPVLPLVAVLIWALIMEYRKDKFINTLIQNWIETKEIPDSKETK